MPVFCPVNAYSSIRCLNRSCVAEVEKIYLVAVLSFVEFFLSLVSESRRVSLCRLLGGERSLSFVFSDCRSLSLKSLFSDFLDGGGLVNWPGIDMWHKPKSYNKYFVKRTAVRILHPVRCSLFHSWYIYTNFWFKFHASCTPNFPEFRFSLTHPLRKQHTTSKTRAWKHTIFFVYSHKCWLILINKSHCSGGSLRLWKRYRRSKT